jgi:aldose 1-epimerase
VAKTVTNLSLKKDNALEITLSITNQCPGAAPVGLGWHPYLTKRADSPGLNRASAQRMIDNCFDGWSGGAMVSDSQLTTRLASDLRRLVVYAEPSKDFIAVEPAIHANNAMNQAGHYTELGIDVPGLPVIFFEE